MQNPFKSIMSKLSGGSALGGGSSDTAVGVDIGASSIKLVELRKKNGRAVLETYSTLALGPYANLDIGATTNLPTETLVKAIADAMREGTISTTNAAFSIPSAASLVFILDLPAAISEKDLATIVPTEARKYIPVPITEVMLDYWVIPHRQEGFYEEDKDASTIPAQSEVLTAAIHNETLNKYREIAKDAGLAADIFEIEVFASIRSTFSHELSAVLLVDVGASKTKLAIVEYGIVRVFHIVNRGSFDITKTMSESLSVPFSRAEDIKRAVGLKGSGQDHAASEVAKLTVDYIVSETKNVIGAFERKYEKPVSKILLTGAGSLMPGFREHMAEAFRTEVDFGNPFDKVEVPAFVANVLAETGPEFAVALGLALRKLG